MLFGEVAAWVPGYTIRQTAIRLPDGRWTIPVDDEVFDRIDAARLPGETDDDTVSRLLRTVIGKKPSQGRGFVERFTSKSPELPASDQMHRPADRSIGGAH